MEDIDMKDYVGGQEEGEELKKVTNNKLTINDFTIIKVIGKGSYGKVLLVKKNKEDKVYAMKVLKKKAMIKRNQVQHIKSERKIMELIDYPFIVKLKYAFQNPQKLYLVMDYCPGGELFFHIQRVERFNEEAVKFYGAQLVLALEHLHKNNIIYRDLKPENVLIDQKGYVKITDFGLSKENIPDNHSAKSFCGTPEYLAPEIIEAKGHGKAVDWWSLGAILYEMLTGMPPFYAKDREKLFKTIKTGNVKFPKYLSKEAVNLLEQLFIKDPDSRLGSGENGVNDIKNHPFFASIDWDAILEKKIKPPFTPKIRSEFDTRYIDPDFTNESPKDSVNVGESLDNNENPYTDFSYDPSKEKNNEGNNIE
jgi:protein-serine/threonine kinase